MTILLYIQIEKKIEGMKEKKRDAEKIDREQKWMDILSMCVS